MRMTDFVYNGSLRVDCIGAVEQLYEAIKCGNMSMYARVARTGTWKDNVVRSSKSLNSLPLMVKPVMFKNLLFGFFHFNIVSNFCQVR